jgi:hypothetical protein
MMTPMPQKLGTLGRDNPKVLTNISGDWLAVLNEGDRKLSAAFTCKNPLMFWGGLEALCAGLAVAALAVAVVATGGLAAVAIGVCVAACAGGVAAGVTALVKMNECDKCLQQWQLPHSHVSVEGKKALLQTSFLSCSNGGVITIVLDPVVAQSAAEKISSNNNKEVLLQMGSQFLEGIIAIAANGNKFGGPAGLAVAAILAPIDYVRVENKKENDRKDPLNDLFLHGDPLDKQNSVGSQIGYSAKDFGKNDSAPVLAAGATDAARITATTTETSVMSATAKEATVISGGGVTAVSASEASVISVSQKTATTTLSTAGAKTTSVAVEATAASASKASAVIVGEATGEGITAVAAKSITMTSEESLEIAVKAGFNGSTFIKGLGVGLVGAAVNIGIGVGVGIEQDKLYKESVNIQYYTYKNNTIKRDIKLFAERK